MHNLGRLYYKEHYTGNADVASINRQLQTCSIPNQAKAYKIEEASDYSFNLMTTYPGLLLGTGYTHEASGDDEAFKTGFYFDHVTGVPCFPGHSVKGVLRSVFPNHKNERHSAEKSELIAYYLEEIGVNLQQSWEGFDPDRPYGLELFVRTLGELIFDGKKGTETLPIYKRDIFHDAYITKGAANGYFLGEDYITPHYPNVLKNPTPIKFLKIRPEVTICFQFELKSNLISDKSKKALFERILLDIGIGAKTNVGYGQLRKADAQVPESIAPPVMDVSSEILKAGQEVVVKAKSNKGKDWFFEVLEPAIGDEYVGMKVFNKKVQQRVNEFKQGEQYRAIVQADFRGEGYIQFTNEMTKI